jgi:hypothetical protein
MDMPADATALEGHKYNDVPIKLLGEVKNQSQFDRTVAERERILRAAKHEKFGTMFVDRVQHANGSLTLISWDWPKDDHAFLFDTYFRVGPHTLQYSGAVSADRKSSALSVRNELSREWKMIEPSLIPDGIGFVVGDMILNDSMFNEESWSLRIKLAGKPDVSFGIAAYTKEKASPGLRDRAGGLLTSLLGAVAGLSQLRNRSRPVVPIQADEILVAGTQDGKRLYAFKWEAPGKAYSLAEPNLNVSLQVVESAYLTNRESFAGDEEALDVWDAVVDSIRLRPGAV